MALNYLGFSCGQRDARRGSVTVYEYERGLLYARGRFVRVLEPGRYRIWPFTYRRIIVIDTRRASAQIANQKLLTADQITVTLNLVADYELADVAVAVHKTADFRSQLYQDVQLAARNTVGAVTVDVLLNERVRINSDILQTVKPSAEAYGVRVLNVGIKDVILAPRVRDLLMKEAEAKRVAQATLIGAREEVAALRALANAARLAAEHPQLLRLRELDAVRGFAQTPGNTVVVGVNGLTPLPIPSKPQLNGESETETHGEE
jgi:regulator of protease activity HflC (stomatin/prohibitin superfamily)